MRTTALEPPRDFDSPFHSQGILVSRCESIVFASGQVGVRPDGSRGADVAQQTRISFENVDRVLAEAGLSLGDIVSLRIYLTSHEHIGTFSRAAARCMRGHRPAATLLVLEHLADPSLLVQVEAVAAGD